MSSIAPIVIGLSPSCQQMLAATMAGRGDTPDIATREECACLTVMNPDDFESTTGLNAESCSFDCKNSVLAIYTLCLAAFPDLDPDRTDRPTSMPTREVPSVPELLNPKSRGMSVMYDAGGEFLGCEEGPSAFMNDCVKTTNFIFAAVSAEPTVVDDVSCNDIYSNYVEETDTYRDPMYSDVTMYYPGGRAGMENAMDDLLDDRAHLERWQRTNIAAIDSCSPLTCEAITNKRACLEQGCRYNRKKGCRAQAESESSDRVCGELGVRLLEGRCDGGDCSFGMKKVNSACECEDACDGLAYTFGTRNSRCICFANGAFKRDKKFKNLFISGNFE